MDSKRFWQQMRQFNLWFSRNYRRGFGPARLVLLLTTTGRRTGIPRTTPLQYEIYDGVLYAASARGAHADWFLNILADPRVRVQIGKESFEAVARPVTDPGRVAGFLELRLQQHPVMLRLIMCLFEGLPWRFTSTDLLLFASQKALVAIPYGGKDDKAGFEESV